MPAGSRARLGALTVLTLTIGVSAGSISLEAWQAAATCSRVWLGHEAEFEQALKTATVTKLEDVPIGVTRPRRARVELPTLVSSFAWKVLPPGRTRGFFESYKSEIAAYELDKMLSLGMVPPIVERIVKGEKGAAIYWVDDTSRWDVKNPVKGPEPAWSRQLTRMKMFDLLIANIDRNQGNLIYDADFHLFLIDHSRAFTDKKDLKGLSSLAYVDRELWTRMQALTLESLKAGLGDWVDGGELRALLTRRAAMATEIEKMVASRGERTVFIY
jgi:hypothetical protein